MINKVIEIEHVTTQDETFLSAMLYEAVFVPEGQPRPSQDIVKEPFLSLYVEEWGLKDDIGFKAVCDGNAVGAVWIRLLKGEKKGFGYVDDYTPELSIAIASDHRGAGIGGRLIRHLMSEVQSQYKGICLSVSKDNPACRLYFKLGFEPVSEIGSTLTMVKRLQG